MTGLARSIATVNNLLEGATHAHERAFDQMQMTMKAEAAADCSLAHPELMEKG